MIMLKDLDYYEKITFDNEDSFTREFCRKQDVMELTHISWSAEWTHFVYIIDSGAHLSDRVENSKFMNWVMRVK
jgi:hypothetical protein